MWQESENTWGVRLKAQPFRTDLQLERHRNSADERNVAAGETLRETPVQFSVEWKRRATGPVHEVLHGEGPRDGAAKMQIDVTLQGTPAKLQVTSEESIEDFRRYDITERAGAAAGGALRWRIQFDRSRSSRAQCAAPAGSGLITLKGDVGLPGSHSYGLVLAAENLPVGAAAALVERAKKNLPEDLVAGGTISGTVSVERKPRDGIEAANRRTGRDCRVATGIGGE